MYEHPWVYKWSGFLYDSNKEVYNRANLVGMAITFKMCFELFTGNHFGAFISWSLIMACFKVSSEDFNPITITAAKLELVRLVRSGKKDPFASIIIFTNMCGDEYVFSSKEFKPLDLATIKNHPMLKMAIISDWPIWLGPSMIRVSKKGRMPDANLFRAVLAGHEI